MASICKSTGTMNCSNELSIVVAIEIILTGQIGWTVEVNSVQGLCIDRCFELFLYHFLRSLWEAINCTVEKMLIATSHSVPNLC